MSASDVIMTREIAPLPGRADDAHKGDMGRLLVIGGCAGERIMIGAPALTANAALRSGAGLIQLMVPEAIAHATAILAPCATAQRLPSDVDRLVDAIETFGAHVLAIGPGLGDSLAPDVVASLLHRTRIPVVIDADGLNLLARSQCNDLPDASRIVMTPHPGEMGRLLAALDVDIKLDGSFDARREAACALVEAYGCVAVLKGRGTIVTNGQRLYLNETGNSGLATGGTGDVLTGVIAALIGQGMQAFEAAVLGVFLHGLAADFTAEELGRYAMTALDLIEYLPEAFREHEMTAME